MATIRVMILRAGGTNCDLETEHAWRLAGAEPERVHLRRLIEKPPLLDDFQILTLPGGFSYGDDIAAGRIFAAKLRRYLAEVLREFVASERLVLGICNGFQILVQAGLLPYSNGAGTGGAGRTESASSLCTLAQNEPPGFQDRWVTLAAAAESPCVFIEPGRNYEMPIAHGEGCVRFADAGTRDRVLAGGLGALRYVPAADGGEAPPYNPNGSEADIAGLCDPSGHVFGLMPHPERFVAATQHPCWTSRPEREEGDGLAIFHRAVAYFG